MLNVLFRHSTTCRSSSANATNLLDKPSVGFVSLSVVRYVLRGMGRAPVKGMDVRPYSYRRPRCQAGGGRISNDGARMEYCALYGAGNRGGWS